MNNKRLAVKANKIRLEIINMIYEAGSGHIAGSLSLTEIMTFLYFKELKVNPKNPKFVGRDFLFLSNGHVAPLLYAVLAEKGFFKKEELKTLRKIGTRLQGHPHFGSLPGIENTGGPLAQGISQAVGLASSLKRDGKKNRVFCIMGDGELAEGECWEAFLYASKEKLDNLTVIIDNNNIQIDGYVNDITGLENLHKKLSSFGFYVVEFDGNNMEQINSVLSMTKSVKEKPLCLIAKTISGKGVSFMENDFKWHGKVPTKKEKDLTINEINEKIKKQEIELKEMEES